MRTLPRRPCPAHPATPGALTTLAAACALALGGTALASPPSPPLELTLAPGAADSARGTLAFAVLARPLVAAETLRVDVVTPADAPLVQGPAHAARAHVRADCVARGVRGRTRHVYVRATLVTADGTRYTRGEDLAVALGRTTDAPPAARPSADGPGGTVLAWPGAILAPAGAPSPGMRA